MRGREEWKRREEARRKGRDGENKRIREMGEKENDNGIEKREGVNRKGNKNMGNYGLEKRRREARRGTIIEEGDKDK